MIKRQTKSSNTREKLYRVPKDIPQQYVGRYAVVSGQKETPPSQKKQQDCCQCYCEKCRDCYRQPCKIHKPSPYTGTPTTTSTGAYFPSQKKDKRTYEETLETVRKLSKLMQKEGWENDLDGLLCSYKVLDQETFTATIARFIKSLLQEARQEERERIKKELLEVLEKV